MLNCIIGLLIITLLHFSCSKDAESDKFVPPTITNTYLTPTSKKSLHLDRYFSLSKPIFAGKYKFGDLVDVNPIIRSKDTTYQKDFIQKIKLEIEDKFDYNGFDLITDYSKNIFYKNPFDDKMKFDSTFYCYYPVYFVNSTNTDKLFPFGSHFKGVQEVSRYNTNYCTIEINEISFCGVGSGGLIVRPREYVMVLMKKYDGEQESPFRVRFKIGSSIYVSKPFLGKYQAGQFQIEDSSYLHSCYRNKNFHFIPGADMQRQRIIGYDFPPIDSLILPKKLNNYFKENEVFWSNKFDPIDIVIEPNSSNQKKYDYRVDFNGLQDFNDISNEEWEVYLVNYIKGKKIKLKGTLESNSHSLECQLILDNEEDLMKTLELMIELLSNHQEISRLVSKNKKTTTIE